MDAHQPLQPNRKDEAQVQPPNARAIEDQVVARLSHDMRSPLSSILTWVQMLQHRDMTDEQVHEGLAVIERSAMDLKDLIDELHDPSRSAPA